MNPAIQDLLTRWGPVPILETIREQISVEAALARYSGTPEDACTLEAIAGTLRMAALWYAKLERQEAAR